MSIPAALPPLVLLDLDGTISDSSSGITRSLQHAFAACGHEPPTPDQVREVIGPPFEIGLPRLGLADREVPRVVDAYRERYEVAGLFENEVYAGVPELLAALDGMVEMAVATAKPESTAERIIEHFGFTDHFTAVIGATIEVGSTRRTKAQVINHALRVLGTEPGPDAVMVGDRDHDVEGALANGIACIGVSWGFGSTEELRGAGAATVIDSPDEVVAALASTYRDTQR